MTFRERIKPHVDILLFIIALLAANYFWKFSIAGDEGGGPVTWFGLDITAPFDFMAKHIAAVVFWIVHLFRDTIILLDDTTLAFTSNSAVRIVWSCTAIKQAFIWLIIMLVARGPWIKKLWFIPLGWLFAYLFNILRITLITMTVEHYPELFELLHAYVFKYLFYIMLFGLWIWWTHRISYVSFVDKIDDN